MLKYYLYALLVLILDQCTKFVIVRTMEIGDAYSVIGDFFLITSHRNKGAAFGILQNQRWFFIAITLIVAAAIVWYLRKVAKENKKLLPFSLSLLLGGALGNFSDRLFFGEVVDFFQFNFGNYTFPIFNVADSAIVVGVILVFFDQIMEARKKKREAVTSHEQ